MEAYDKEMEIMKAIERITSEKAVVVFVNSTCCFGHAVKRLFSNLGVHPAVYELDKQTNGGEIEKVLRRVSGSGAQVLPCIYIGKKHLGGLNELICAHISGGLVPQLKQAGALWL